MTGSIRTENWLVMNRIGLFALASTYYFILGNASGLQVRCKDNTLVIVGNSSGGLEIQVDIQVVQNPIVRSFEVIDNCYLPPQCLLDRENCNSVDVGSNWIALPANGSLVFINQESPNQHHIERINNLNCDPTNLFFDEQLQQLWVACKRASNTSSSSRLYYLSYRIYMTGDNLTIYALFDSLTVPSWFGFISRSVFIQHPLCSSHGESNLYVMADRRVCHYPASPGVNPAFRCSEEPLENCSSVAYIDFSGGTTFTVHCSGGVSATYDTCSGRWEHHHPENGLHFPCSSQVDVNYKNDSIRVILSNGTTLWQRDHSVGAILRGQCNSDFFNAVTANGSLYTFSLRSGEFYKISGRVCDNMTCIRSTFDQESSNFVSVNKEQDTLILVSDVEECTTPVLETRNISIPSPVLIHLTSSTGSHSCQCKSSESATTADTSADTAQDVTSSIGVKFPSGDERLSRNIAIGVVLPSSVIVITVLFILFIVWFLCKARRKRQTNGHLVPLADPESFPQPVECESQDRGGVVAGQSTPLHTDQILNEDIIKNQESYEGKTEDNRNKRMEKTNAMLNFCRK